MGLTGEDKKEYQRKYMQARRSNKGSNITGSNKGGLTVEMFEGKPRFFELYDYQILDRTYQPNPNKHIPEMIACNEANSNFKPRKDR